MSRANPSIVRDCLQRARARIATPARWCRGALARDGQGSPLISELHPAAASWSVLGAVCFALHERRADLRLEAHETPAGCAEGVAAVVAVARAVDPRASKDNAHRVVADFADVETRSHGEIVALFTKALAEASPRPRAVQETGT